MKNLPQAHLMIILMAHARMVIVILLQSHHHITSCLKVTQRKIMLMVDNVDSCDELVSKLASMTMALENEMAKTSKLEK
jgi:phosphoglycerol transferase MdoB-like AlkP superfamily enzyme